MIFRLVDQLLLKTLVGRLIAIEMEAHLLLDYLVEESYDNVVVGARKKILESNAITVKFQKIVIEKLINKYESLDDACTGLTDLQQLELTQELLSALRAYGELYSVHRFACSHLDVL